MNIGEYEKQFDEILEGKNKQYPYDSDEYINYVKMNQVRIKRWRKKGKISDQLTEIIKGLGQTLNWVLITEPWCGDAAHSQAFIEKLKDLNPKINLKIQNRDTEESEIDNYLTNGSKSIPMLIVRDADQKDIFTWGPRPLEAQNMVMEHKNNPQQSDDEHSRDLQKWYNKNKGKSMQDELIVLFKNAHLN